MHSLPQGGIGVPYVHDDCHNLYRPVNQSDVKPFRFTVVHNVHVLKPGQSQHTRYGLDQMWQMSLDLTQS